MRVTRDDYLNKFAIDLDLEFRGSNYDNETKAVEVFLTNNEENLVDYLKYTYNIDDTCENWNETEFTRALLQQNKHILSYGDIDMKGIRDENGNYIPFLAPKARAILSNVGMLRNSFSRYGDY